MGMIPSVVGLQAIDEEGREVRERSRLQSPERPNQPEQNEESLQKLVAAVAYAPPPNSAEQSRLDHTLSRLLRGVPPDFGPVRGRILEATVKNACVTQVTNGYFVGITRGLWAISSEDELAAVIAHEFGHIIDRKPTNMAPIVNIMNKYSVPTQRIINFISWSSRSHEHVADSAGVDLLIAAGYDPNALQRTLARIPAEISSTHPSSERRAKFLQWYSQYRMNNQ
jgi:Zn-dependent protease with chaperone function